MPTYHVKIRDRLGNTHWLGAKATSPDDALTVLETSGCYDFAAGDRAVKFLRGPSGKSEGGSAGQLLPA